MKPKLAEDCFYVPVADGAYLRSGRGSLHLKGRHIYEWLDRLAPELDGLRTLTELTEGLATERRQMIDGLVQVLADNGMVRDLQEALPHGLSETELALYAEEIAFIDSTVGSGAHRFEDFRNRRVLLMGGGSTVTALVQAVLQLGARRVDVAITDEAPTDTARHGEYVDWRREKDPELSLTSVRAADAESSGSLASALSRYAVVIHCSDRPMLARAARLNRALSASGTVLIQALVVSGVAWIGPLVRGPGGCWECAWRRLLGGLRPGSDAIGQHQLTDHVDVEPGPFLSGPLCAVVAHTLAFEWFKHATGAGAIETDQRLVRIDLETAATTAHPFSPHPFCSVCGGPPSLDGVDLQLRMAAMRSGEPVGIDQVSQRAVGIFDRCLGILRFVEERESSQLPLNVATAVAADAEGGRTGPRRVTAVDTAFAAARRHATVAGCELYASTLVRAGGSTDAGRALQRWGWNLSTDRPQQVLPDYVASSLQVTAGLTWPEAVLRGVLLHCRPGAAGWTNGRGGPDAELSAEQLVGVSGEAQRLFSLVRLTREGPVAVAASLLAPSLTGVNVRVGEVEGQGCGLNLDTALRCALRCTVAQLQGVTPAEPHWSIPAVGQLSSADEGLARVVSDLREIGWEVWATPVDQDRALSAVLPYLAAVALLQGR